MYHLKVFKTNEVLRDCVLWLVVREGVTPDAAEQSDSVQGPVHRKDRLIQEKRLVEVNSAHSLSGKVFTKSVCQKHPECLTTEGLMLDACL